MHATIDDWIQADAIPFSLDSNDAINGAIDAVVGSLDDAVELLGFGEALHGGEEILLLRNRFFQRLVEAHGYTAIAIESSFTAGRIANEYVLGGTLSYDKVKDRGFSHGFGQVEANRELIEWMRHYNADVSHRAKVRFYGFDIPGTGGYASPSGTLRFTLDYLCEVDAAAGETHRRRIEAVLGDDAAWENPAVYMDPTKSVALSPAALSLRIATEDLLTELRVKRPESVAKSSRERYAEGLQHALIARELLNSHAALANKAGYAALLGIRDALMADNLTHIVERERERGSSEASIPRAKVFVFAHNSHLQRGKVALPVLGEWWPAGSQLDQTLGRRYAVVGSAVGVSEANGIGLPEPGSLEARLTRAPGSARFVPTRRGIRLAAAEVATIPVRSGSAKNPTYVPLRPQSLADFDWLVALNSTTYTRGGRPL
jgi:erythromycin esterase